MAPHQKKHFILNSEIKPQDVLFGKGGLSAGHIGTIAFKATVESRLETYRNATSYSMRNGKHLVTLQILNLVQLTGGRFLVRAEDRWCMMDTKTACIKVREFFREFIKNLRKQRRPCVLLDRIGVSGLFGMNSTYVDIILYIAGSASIRHFLGCRSKKMTQRKVRAKGFSASTQKRTWDVLMASSNTSLNYLSKSTNVRSCVVANGSSPPPCVAINHQDLPHQTRPENHSVATMSAVAPPLVDSIRKQDENTTTTTVACVASSNLSLSRPSHYCVPAQTKGHDREAQSQCRSTASLSKKRTGHLSLKATNGSFSPSTIVTEARNDNCLRLPLSQQEISRSANISKKDSRQHHSTLVLHTVQDSLDYYLDDCLSSTLTHQLDDEILYSFPSTSGGVEARSTKSSEVTLKQAMLLIAADDDMLITDKHTSLLLLKQHPHHEDGRACDDTSILCGDARSEKSGGTRHECLEKLSLFGDDEDAILSSLFLSAL